MADTWTEGFYGIYSFKFDKNNTGLITRTPGEYDSSMISLWIYNDKSQTITRSMRLSNIFGDAGDFDVYNSWLFSEKDNGLKVLMYDYYSYDHSVEDENDTIVDITKEYLLLKVKAEVSDTLSKNPDELKKRFARQLEKMSF
ncbi:hypothetical protein [Flavobacterium sp. 3HN19-14]|uniref:hypothetical protein n=1 Tax=Flavobacterium sp. 3HN19-14 TaxID=3448133 RepID=UPI003EE28932